VGSNNSFVDQTTLWIRDPKVLPWIRGYLTDLGRRTCLAPVIAEEGGPDVVFGGETQRVAVRWYVRLPALAEGASSSLEGEDEDGDPELAAGVRHAVAQYAATLEALVSHPPALRLVTEATDQRKA